MINLKNLVVIGALALSTTSYASDYTIDKTIVQSDNGQHFFSLELNNIIDQTTADQLQVTDGEGNAIKGQIVLIPNGTALKTSIVQFYPIEQSCFKKIITLKLGDVSTRIVPGTSGISGVSAGAMKEAGFAYAAADAASITSGYGYGNGVGILDVIPRHGTNDASPYTPLMVFFGDIIDTDTVTADNMVLEEVDGDSVSGQIGFSTSTAGNTIVTFTPNSPLKANTDYIFKVNPELKDSKVWEQFQEIGVATEPEEGDDDPKTLTQEQVLEKRKAVMDQLQGSYVFNSLIWIPVSYREVPFKTGNDMASATDLAQNMSFEKSNLNGFSKSGHAQVISSYGSLQIQSTESKDNYTAVISTFDKASPNSAGATAGSLVTADITVPAGAQWMAFDTNFITAEFPSYIGSIYDDTYLVSIRTPFGVQTINAASVNSLGLFKVNDSAGAPGLIGSLDKFNIINSHQQPTHGQQPLNGETTWHTRAFYVGGLVGQKINLSFHITNVGDNVFQSSAFIDNIRFVKKQPALKSENLNDIYEVVSAGNMSGEAAQSVATIAVNGGNARNDQRYVLSKAKGSDSYRLSTFNLLDQMVTYFGQKNNGKIELYPEGAVSSLKKMTLEKKAAGYVMSGVNEIATFLNQEKYDLAELIKLVEDKRNQLNGGEQPIPGPIPFPIEPLPPINP